MLPGGARAASAPVFGTAASFGVLGASAVTNTGFSVVTGDLGVSPLLAVTGFPPGIVTGTIYTGILSPAGQAQADALTAYNYSALQACNTILTGQDLGGLTLTPGVYCFASSAQLTGTLTLDFQNDLDAVFIFKMGSTLTTAPNSSVVAINGPPSCNHVVWQVGSSATIDTGTQFLGDILADQSITVNTGASNEGSLYALNAAVTLDDNDITACVPRCIFDVDCVDDGNVCTDEVCVPDSPTADDFGCTHPNNVAPCDDTNFCSVGDVCGGGVCSGLARDCGDSNLCTNDSCDEATNACLNSNNVLPCNDNQFCTTGDICGGGVCSGAPLNCGDGNICTNDSCNEATDACVNSNNVLPCNDNQFCTMGDICAGGICSGAPRDCGDGNICTNNSCNEAIDACVTVNNTLPCNDNLFCTIGDNCGGGTCNGIPNTCGDGILCTNDVCSEATDSCVSAPDNTLCNDVNICTSDVCSPLDGCEHTNNTLPCDDLNSCTLVGQCGNGVCVPGPSAQCGDLVVDPACGEECDALPPGEICNNGIDDDGDGLIDCADTACANVPTEGCVACELVPVCVPIFEDPAVMYVPDGTDRLARTRHYDFAFHGYVVMSTPVSPLGEAVTLVMSNANGEIYRARVPAGQIRQFRRKAWILPHPRDGFPPNERSGIVSLRIRQRMDGGKLGYGIRMKTLGDFSSATLARMTTQIYLGNDVAYLTADWTQRPGRWTLHQKDYQP